MRVGANTGVTPDTVSATQLTFRAPALIAGTYDVWVFNAAGTRSAQLAAALTYVSAGGTEPASSPPGDGSQPGTSDPVASDPGSGTQPGTPDPGSGAQPAPGGGIPSDGVITGPHGEHLHCSAMFASLGASIWTVDCSSSCGGLAV